MTDDIDRRRTVLANRKSIGFYPNLDRHGYTRNGAQWRQRPVDPEPAPDTAWQEQAACHGLTTLFFVDSGERNDEAIDVCQHCPVMWPCRYAALDDRHSPYGVQGGLTADQRTAIRSQWKRIDTTVMRYRRAEALDQSWTLRRETVSA